jgi:hypothetical protein
MTPRHGSAPSRVASAGRSAASGGRLFSGWWLVVVGSVVSALGGGEFLRGFAVALARIFVLTLSRSRHSLAP